jgi:hypothetical protein
VGRDAPVAKRIRNRHNTRGEDNAAGLVFLAEISYWFIGSLVSE